MQQSLGCCQPSSFTVRLPLAPEDADHSVLIDTNCVKGGNAVATAVQIPATTSDCEEPTQFPKGAAGAAAHADFAQSEQSYTRTSLLQFRLACLQCAIPAELPKLAVRPSLLTMAPDSQALADNFAAARYLARELLPSVNRSLIPSPDSNNPKSRLTQVTTKLTGHPPRPGALEYMTTQCEGGFRSTVQLSARLLPLSFPAVTGEVMNTEKQAEQSAALQALMQMGSSSSGASCRGWHSIIEACSSAEGAKPAVERACAAEPVLSGQSEQSYTRSFLLQARIAGFRTNHPALWLSPWCTIPRELLLSAALCPSPLTLVDPTPPQQMRGGNNAAIPAAEGIPATTFLGEEATPFPEGTACAAEPASSGHSEKRARVAPPPPGPAPGRAPGREVAGAV